MGMCFREEMASWGIACLLPFSESCGTAGQDGSSVSPWLCAWFVTFLVVMKVT